MTISKRRKSLNSKSAFLLPTFTTYSTNKLSIRIFRGKEEVEDSFDLMPREFQSLSQYFLSITCKQLDVSLLSRCKGLVLFVEVF